MGHPVGSVILKRDDTELTKRVLEAQLQNPCDERSELNLHKFSIGQSESAECSCHFKNESSQHFLIDCFLYSSERQILFDRVEHFIPKFKNFTKSQKHEILVKGFNINDPDFLYTNTSISIAVQKFIFKSKRFQF